MAVQNIQKANYAKAVLNKMVLRLCLMASISMNLLLRLKAQSRKLISNLLTKGIIGGYDLGRDYPELNNHMLVAVTEHRTKEEIDTFVEELGD